MSIYQIREYKQEDKAFICATFLRGLYYGESWFSLIPKQIFMENYSKVIYALLGRPDIVVKVACLTEDPDVILGYSILSQDLQTLHWVFVKSSKKSDDLSWRRHGIGKVLTNYPIKQVTHLTKLGLTLLPKINAVFNPFMV